MLNSNVTSEIKYIGYATLATLLILCSVPIMIYGAILLLEPFSINGAVIYFAGLSMEVAGTILGDQQKEQLDNKEILKQFNKHFVIGCLLFILLFAYINLSYILS